MNATKLPLDALRKLFDDYPLSPFTIDYLVRSFNCSESTVRKALLVLKQEGYITPSREYRQARFAARRATWQVVYRKGVALR